jgi:hypothetical protein
VCQPPSHQLDDQNDGGQSQRQVKPAFRTMGVSAVVSF